MLPTPFGVSLIDKYTATVFADHIGASPFSRDDSTAAFTNWREITTSALAAGSHNQ